MLVENTRGTPVKVAPRASKLRENYDMEDSVLVIIGIR